MNITLHRVGIRDGDQGCLMAGINKALLISEIAGVCRQSWATKDWGQAADDQDLPAPEIPENDTDVINQYFHSVRWEDEDDFDAQALSYCDWENLTIDLSATQGEEIDLSIDPPLTFSVIRTGDGNAQSNGALFPGCGEVGDAIESFVVALTAAGAPVWHPRFKEALQTVSDALVNNLDDEGPEEMEREMAANGLTLILEPDATEEEANWMLSGPSTAVTPLLDRLPAYSWVTRTEALRAVYAAITQSSDVS